MKGLLFPLLWVGGLTIGIVGTNYLYRAVTLGTPSDLIVGLALFLPGLYVAGTVLARARISYRSDRRRDSRSAHGVSQSGVR